jgi:hypothetical protein
MIYLVGPIRFKAYSSSELVRQMHTASYAPAEDDTTWMEEVADRTELQNGAKLRCDTARNFVADLIAAGLVKMEK